MVSVNNTNTAIADVVTSTAVGAYAGSDGVGLGYRKAMTTSVFKPGDITVDQRFGKPITINQK